MGLTQNLGRLSPSIFSDASLNIGVGAAPSGSYKFEVTGTSKVSGVLTLGATLSNGTYTYTLPAATGTLALTSDIPDLSGYVTLATNQTITGLKNFDLGINIKHGIFPLTLGYTGIGAQTNGLIINVTGGGFGVAHQLLFSTTNPPYTYTFPSADGTLALTSNLSGYLPLTGGTLTGALNGTSASFSSTITSSINTGGVQNQLILENLSVAAGADGNIIYFKGYQGSLAKISAVGFPNDLVGGYLQLQSYSSNTTANIGLIINQNGNVSINNTNNSYQLDVSGTLRVTGAATFSSSIYAATTITANTTVTARLGYTTAGNSTNPSYDDALIIDPSGNGVAMVKLLGGNQFASDYGTALKFTVNGGSGPNNPIDVMTLRSTGNVGIGTNNPSYRLHVQDSTNIGTIAIGNVSYPSLIYSSASSGEFRFDNRTSFSGFITFYPNGQGATLGSEAMRITSGGKLLLNTTTSTGGGGGDRVLELDGNIYSKGADAGYFWRDRTGSTFTGWYTTSGTIYLYSSSTGNIASISPSTGVYTPLSDINKKKDFEQSDLGLNAILGLKPTLYRMKDEDNTDKHLGFVAQEVKEFIPQAYIQTKGEKDDFIGLDYQAITATLVKAIQEQQAQIEELKAIQELTQKVNTLNN
jgi:hypothetical protein